jgi:hypothetical protein
MQPLEIEEGKGEVEEKKFVVAMNHLWDDAYCKICFLPLDKSPLTCGHIVHIECQLKAGALCVECRRPFRLTRWMDRMIVHWRKVYAREPSDDEEET